MYINHIMSTQAQPEVVHTQPVLAEVIPIHPKEESDVAIGGLGLMKQRLSDWMNKPPEVGAGSPAVTRQQIKAINRLNQHR